MQGTGVCAVNPFTEKYYLDGRRSGLSNYEDYRWLPDQTVSMATHLMRYLGIKDGDFTLEIGCARGYYVKALRMFGVKAYGYDISEWAVANCHPHVAPFVSNHLSNACFDVVWSKDTFEHIPPSDLRELLAIILPNTRRKLFAIVPLAEASGGKYIHPKEENDSTHVNRWTLHEWIAFLQDCSNSFIVTGGYHYPGLKPGAFEVEFGYGFLTMERI